MTIEQYLHIVILPILALSAVLILIRFAIGPSFSDRVVTLELLITTGLGAIAVFSVYSNVPTYLDVAMIVALISFLATVAFSHYIEKRKRP